MIISVSKAIQPAFEFEQITLLPLVVTVVTVLRVAADVLLEVIDSALTNVPIRLPPLAEVTEAEAGLNTYDCTGIP